MGIDALRTYQAGAAAARLAPAPLRRAVIEAGATAGELTMADRRRQVERNLTRVLGPDLSALQRRRLTHRSFASYTRYWVESFRLPTVSKAELDWSLDYVGFERILAARAEGVGPIMLLPHLGGWEWAAFWLARVEGLQVTAVVEPIEPPELLEWFTDFRQSLGMNIIPLGPNAGGELLRAIKDRHIVCLLSDRDVGGSGVEVEFFGERTKIPAGAATLALRTGAQILPCGVYFAGQRHHCHVQPPLPAERQGRLRADVQRVTQDATTALEGLIRAAPDQWHLMQPNWPSDLASTTGGDPGMAVHDHLG